MTHPGEQEPGSGAERLRSRRVRVDALYSKLQAEAPRLDAVVANTLGMKFVLVPAGAFDMGAPPEEAQSRENERPQHRVLLTQPFYLSAYLVTQAQYEKVAGQNPARFQAAAGGGPSHPAERVSWDDAVAFCRRLSEMPAERAAGATYRLPTEAEWECACRGGATTPFARGAGLSGREANIDGRYPYGDAAPEPGPGRTTPVGSYSDNNFGLYDVHGNVWEWCADWYAEDYYKVSPPRDPGGPPEGRFRVVRGGSWRNHAATCRAAYRNALVPNNRDPYTGFRVVRVLAAPPPV
jgi:formylglycine-generating enzyme